MTITAPFYPETELVAIALFSTFTGLRADRIATSLPKDPDVWSDEGFVVIASLVAGPAQVDLPQRDGVIQVDLYATAGKAGGALAPWAKASRLVALCRRALEDESFPYGDPVSGLPTGYAAARVLSAYMLTEPQKVRNDPSGYAHYTFDAAIHWTLVS